MFNLSMQLATSLQFVVDTLKEKNVLFPVNVIKEGMDKSVARVSAQETVLEPVSEHGKESFNV